MDIEEIEYELADKSVENQKVSAEANLTPYYPTAEVEKAVWDFGEKVREAIAVNPADWPKGRTLMYEVEFTVVPKTLTAKFGQE
jgi:hypothetical protein